jgi:Spy/CpxP family protein refolding chaperone
MKRTLVATAVTLMFAVSLFAQTPGAAGQRPNPLTRLKNALGLTDAQVTAITNLAQAERPRAQTIMADIKQKRQTLNTLLNAASPNPSDVGNAAIALHTAQNGLKTERDNFLTQVKAQLTTDQVDKLDTLEAAAGGGFFPFPGLAGPGFRGRGGR